MAEKGKVTEDAKRGDSWAINPHDAVIEGFDTKPDLDNDCYDEMRLRKLHDKPAVAALSAAILACRKVVQAPVLKKKKDKNGKEYYAVKAGRRRILAARDVYDELKKEGVEFKVTCLLADRFEDRATTLLHVTAENSNRVDNTPMERARDLQRFLEFSGETIEKPTRESIKRYGDANGLQESTVRNYLMLLRAAPKTQALADAGALPVNLIREIVDIEDHAEQEAKATEYATKAAEEGKGANLLEIARFEKNVRQGTKNAENNSVGLSRGQILGVLKLIEEDSRADGKEPSMSVEHIEAFEAVSGSRAPDRLKGLKGYLNRLDKMKKDRAEKKAHKANGTGAAAAE